MDQNDSNKTNKTRKGIIKIDSMTIKTLPVSTGLKRYKDFEVSREYNGNLISISALESLNGYDMLALFQMIDDYQHKTENWQKIGEITDNGKTRAIMQRELNLNTLCEQRGISTNKNNRKTIAKSFKRWYQSEIDYIYPEEIVKSRYIYEFKVNEGVKEITIVANVDFLDFCIQNGMAMNWQRLTQYGNNIYAIELDIYLQFNAILQKSKRYYRYPSVIREETLFQNIGLDNDIKEEKGKRRRAKEAFKAIERVTGQEYIYKSDENGNYWIHTRYLKYIENKNKKA